MEQLNNLPFNIFDGSVILVILGSAIFAYARGFFHEICSIAGWIGAILATVYGFHHVQPYARKFITMDILADLATGTLIFLSALVILSIVTRNISLRIRNSALNSIDRALGFLFGIFRGALIIIIVYIGLGFLIPQTMKLRWIQEARTIQFVKPAANFLVSNLPENYVLKHHRNQTNANKTKKGKDTNDVVRGLIKPKLDPSMQQVPEGYGVGELQDMERLIRNTQPK